MPETLFLTVNLIDRFLALKPVTRRNLQLVSAFEQYFGADYKAGVYIYLLACLAIGDWICIDIRLQVQKAVVRMLACSFS